MEEKNFDKLSKIVSHALRHEPYTYNLLLDEEGWVLLSELVIGLNAKGMSVDEKDIVEMVNLSSKKRHQIIDGKIRAYYGHSIIEKIVKQSVEPPEFLFHGTLEKNISKIHAEGILPMNRQYVHLSSDEETARIVASRRKGKVIILIIEARQAYSKNICFYKEENEIWLSEAIPSKFISIYGTNRNKRSF